MTAARRKILRWGLRAVVLAVLVVLVGVDARMKGGLGGGFAPANANWVAYAPRFSQVWSGLSRTPAWRNFRMQWGAPYNKAQLFVRTTSGIRPTPLRWSTWLGRKALVFGADKEIGWCVRPGLLLRAAHAINAAVSTQPEPGSFRYGPYHYSWREGFLLFSTSPEVLRDALSGEEVGAADSLGRDEFYVRWQAAPSGSLVISARDGLPVRVLMEGAPQDNANGVYPWPDGSFLRLNASDSSVFTAMTRFLRWQFSTLPEWCRAGDLVPDPLPYVAAAQQAGPLAESALALFAPDSKDTRVPETALRFRLQPGISAPLEAVPPLKGAVSGSFWYLAANESILQALVTQPDAGPAAPQALVFEVDWQRAGKAFENYLRAVLEADETLREPIEGTGIPATQALATLGRLYIEGQYEDGRLSVKGNLALPAAKQP